MADLHRVYCTHCEQTFLTSVGETKCDLCGKAGGLTDPDTAVIERIRREMERPPPKTYASVEELIDDPSASGVRKVLAIVGILGFVNFWLLFQFGFRRNGPPAWVITGLVVVLNSIVLGVYLWRFWRANRAASVRRDTSSSIPPERESAAVAPDVAPPTDAIRSADDSIRR